LILHETTILEEKEKMVRLEKNGKDDFFRNEIRAQDTRTTILEEKEKMVRLEKNGKDDFFRNEIRA